MNEHRIHDSRIMRIIRDDVVIYNTPEVRARLNLKMRDDDVTKVIYESHRIMYIPRIGGELCLLESYFADQSRDTGKWKVTDNFYKELGEFAEVEKMTKWVKSRFVRQINKQITNKKQEEEL